MVLEVLFWILLILTAISGLLPDTTSPYIGRGKWIVLAICVGLLGYRVFGGIR